MKAQAMAGRWNLAQTAAVSALWLAALMLLGLVLAYWTWTWLGPRPVPRVEPTLELPAATALFGTLGRGEATEAPGSGAIKLLGVIAAAGGREGYAVLRVDGKHILAVRAGEDVVSGVRLQSVFPDRVVLERGGARETLLWPERAK